MNEKLYVLDTAEVKAGNVLIADGGFTCLQEGQECLVRDYGKGLYVECSAGEHYLDGQLTDDEERYVGFLKKE